MSLSLLLDPDLNTNPDPDPGKPNKYGSMRIRIRNTAKQDDEISPKSTDNLGIRKLDSISGLLWAWGRSPEV